jgi:branched-chain amino acid transport system substrate-binding protein
MERTRTFRKGVRSVTAVAVVALLASACEGSRDEETATTSGNGGTTATTVEGTPPTLIDASQCPPFSVEGDTIKLGISIPQSGLYSAFDDIRVGAEIYFDAINAQGGVTIGDSTYKIELTALDDAYDAQQTVNNVNELINDENVFALFSVVGTKNNLAIRDIVQEQCVPDLFAATGAAAWGNQNYPWLVGTPLVPYPLEMKALVDYLQENNPTAKVAILRASDDFGATYSEVFSSLIEGTDITVAKEETYNPEVFDTKSQITSLAATDADVLILGTTLLACPDALGNVKDAGWKPMVYLSGTCTSKTIIGLAGDAADGVFSVSSFMDPADPEWESNAQMQLFKDNIAEFGPDDADPESGVIGFGWSAAAMLVESLERSPELSRAAVMETTRTLTEVSEVGLMVPGATFNLGADDWFLGETFNLVQYSFAKGYFEVVEGPLDFDGQTTTVTPDDLING